MSVDSRPIVVGGCYRSGTSLVRRLLDSHPRIHCGPEVKLFRDFYSDYLDVEDPIAHLRFLATARSALPEPELLEVLGGALVEMHERAARAAGKPRWADKVPENVVFLDEWERILGEDWVFLHVVRNPLDTLASIEELGFPKSIPPGLEERIDLYLEYAQAGLRFAQKHPGRYVRVLYEDLVSDPEAAVSGLMASLGESFDSRQLAINSTPHQAGLEDPKAGRASEVHRGSVGRWPEVLSAADGETIIGRTAAVWSQFDPEARHRDLLAQMDRRAGSST
jgi:sulfotransferase family protein